MNHDEFEDRIRRQPFRPVPGTWKDLILDSAREAAPAATWDRPAPQMRSEPWARLWREWLWPNPVAWAVLMAVWLVVGTVNWSNREHAQRLVRQTPSAPTETMLILQEQQRRWGDLVAAWRTNPRAAAKLDPRSKPSPRSHFYENPFPRFG